MKSILLSNKKDYLPAVYADYIRNSLAVEANLDEKLYNENDLRENPELFKDVTCVFSTWGMPNLNEKDISELLPNLQCVFYAAGSVQAFARTFLARKVRVFSAWAANAVPVAEYTVAQIILANKGFFRTYGFKSELSRQKSKELMAEIRGNYGATVGIIGAGMIGKRVINMLKKYCLNIIVFDPFLPEEDAKEMGVEKVTLEELFRRSHVVSNHLANNEATKGMLTGSLFSSMPHGAAFLNTGRGAQVRENELIDVLRKRDDLTAVLDVTDPTRPAPDSPLYSLSNCILTPHIAGSQGDEFYRMAECMLEEFRLWKDGKPTNYEVTEQMLLTMA